MSVCHPDWRDRAACRGSGHLFVIPEHTRKNSSRVGFKTVRRMEQAKAICAGCPVRTECLNDYIDTPDSWMIAGGYTPKERAALVREQAS